MSLKVTVVNDYPVIVRGVGAVLDRYSHRIEVVPEEAVAAGVVPVDVALYDTFSAQVGPYDRLQRLRCDPSIGAVAVYSFTTDLRAINDALGLGAGGFLSKTLPAPELVAGIEQVASGKKVTMLGAGTGGDSEYRAGPDKDLSVREKEMIALIVKGYSNVEIAELTYLSVNTVKSYIRAAYRKVGVISRVQAVAWGIRNGYLSG